MGFLRALAWWLYQGLQILFLGLSGPFYALRRGGKGLGHYLPTLRGRATLDTPPTKISSNAPETTEPPVWIHAVSVGEVGVAATFAARLPSSLPLVITTVTPTGQAHANRLFQGKTFEGRHVRVAYLPFDLSPAVHRFIRRFQPRALVLTEGDYWPLTLSILQQRGIPIAVVNGRISDRAFRRQQRIGRANDLFYAPVQSFGLQTEQDRKRLIALGAESSRVHVTGNLKFDSRPPTEVLDVEKQVQELAAGRPILVAGSTMDGEDELVLDAFVLAGGGESALLVLVPRHPERWDHVERLMLDRGHPTIRRSAFGPESTGLGSKQRVDLVLLDSMGELASLYRIAAAAFIGGTLVPTGGHNPLEPAVFGTPTVVGPSMFNFQEMADSFDQFEAWGRAADSDELGRLWRAWLEQPQLGQAVGRRALELLEANRGALNRTLELLQPLLARSPEP